jgi:hypothetical protein
MEAEGKYDWYNLNQPDTPEAHVSQIAPRKDWSELYHKAIMDFKKNHEAAIQTDQLWGCAG